MKFYWIKENATELIEEQLANGVSIDALWRRRGDTARTMLHESVVQENLPMVRFFLTKKADPNICSSDGWYPVHVAAYNCSIGIMQWLIFANTDLNVQRPNGMTAVKIAAQNKDFDMLRLLAQNKADINIPDNDGYTALSSAAAQQEDDLCDLLLDLNANPNIQTKDKLSAMFYFVLNKKIELLQKAIAGKVKGDVNLRGKNGQSLLKVAGQADSEEAMQILLDAGADINAQDDSGYTALNSCMASEHFDSVKFLLEHGAEPNIANNEGIAPLHYAILKGRLDIAELLLEHGAKPDFEYEKEYSLPLRLAVLCGKPEMVELLLKYNADINALSFDKKSALGAAITEKRLDMVDLLLEHGADPNCNAVIGLAASVGNVEVLEKLLAAKGDPNKTEGKFPPPIFFITRYPALRPVFEKYEIKWDARDSRQSTILHSAAVYDQGDLIQDLIDEKGLSVDMVDDFGETPLFRAVKDKKLNALNALLKKGANINHARNDGMTVYHFAVLNGDAQLVETLLKAGADPYIEREGYPPVLLKAIAVGYTDVLKVAIPYLKKNPEAWKIEAQKLLHRAIRDNNTEALSALCEVEEPGLFQWDARNEGDATFLHFAAEKGNVDLIRDLIENKGIPVDVLDGFNETPLQRAIREGHYDAVKYLLEKGADVNHLRKDGASPFHLAVLSGNAQIVKAVLEAGANPYVEYEGRSHVLLTAISRAQGDVLKEAVPYLKKDAEAWNKIALKLLYRIFRDDKKELFPILAEGKDINSFHIADKTALIAAVQWHSKNFVQRALDWGADINAQTESGWTALAQAALSEDYDMTGFLFEKGANPNVLVSGRPLISRAAYRGKTKVLELLLKNGADVTLCGDGNKSALFGAVESRVAETLVPLLKCENLNLNPVNKSGQTPLCFAVEENLLNIAVLLLKAKANPNWVRGKKSLLELAIRRGNDEMAAQLLKYGADWDILNSKNQPMIELAITKGCVKVVRMMFEKGAVLNVRNSLEERAALIKDPMVRECVLKYGRARLMEPKLITSQPAQAQKNMPQKSIEITREN